MTTPDDVARALADPDARERLRIRHAAEARADLARIHPTWQARALREESPAVRATVAARGPRELAVRLGAAREPFPTPDRPPHPEVLDWVMALWTERFVGGPDRDDDPPTVVALMRPPLVATYRLLRTVALAKSAMAGEGDSAWIEPRLGGAPSPDLRLWAGRDVKAARDAATSGRHDPDELLGLVTAFRLLSDCEPFLIRRVLQRLPYPTVRAARAIVPPTSRQAPAAIRLEGLILRAAWDRLFEEGGIAIPHPPEGPS